MEAKELLQEIKERVFKDTDLSRLAGMSEEERRELLLQQTERLLSTHENHEIIYWMSDQIIDREVGAHLVTADKATFGLVAIQSNLSPSKAQWK